jgi:hypothetical protein
LSPKRTARQDQFKRIGEALTSIYKEAEWRHRREDHEFKLRPEVVKSDDVTSRTAGGPAMKTLQYECGTRGIRGLSLIADRLNELQKVESRNEKR